MNSKSYVSYLFKKIKNLTFANPGVTRATYGTGENATHNFLIKEIKQFTNDIKQDFGGNFLAVYKGKSKKKNKNHQLIKSLKIWRFFNKLIYLQRKFNCQ